MDTNTAHEQGYNDGYDAYANGDLANNPYPWKSVLGNAWEAGFEQAQRNIRECAEAGL